MAFEKYAVGHQVLNLSFSLSRSKLSAGAELTAAFRGVAADDNRPEPEVGRTRLRPPLRRGLALDPRQARIERYRREAARLRAQAETTHNPDIRQQLRDIARQ